MHLAAALVIPFIAAVVVLWIQSNANSPGRHR